MATNDDAVLFLIKARESLAGAVSEHDHGRLHNAANRCYYACFQAAIAALMRDGVRPSGRGEWGHGFVQAQFAGLLIQRRKLYPSDLADVLPQLLELRQIADYEIRVVPAVRSERALRRARTFVATIETAIGAST